MWRQESKDNDLLCRAAEIYLERKPPGQWIVGVLDCHVDQLSRSIGSSGISDRNDQSAGAQHSGAGEILDQSNDLRRIAGWTARVRQAGARRPRTAVYH